MDNEDRWYFTKERLANTPSRKCGISENKELSFRQQAANFIQDMGQRLQVSQLCINTAIVYMHRFYVFHSFTEIHRNKLSLSALFLAAKIEEQPRKLEHLIKVANHCLHKEQSLDVRSEAYQDKMLEVVIHENMLLQTLGFKLAIEHPHTFVVKVCQLVKASKDLAQTSYIMATTSLHMTTMCLEYKPTLVACVCVHLACKWSRWKIEPCSEGRDWFFYIDRSVTNAKLEELTEKFLEIMEASPHRFRKKFGQKDVNYQNPRSMIDGASTSSAVKQEFPVPGPSSSSSFNLADFEDDKKPTREKSPTKSTSQPPVPGHQTSSVKRPSSSQSAPSQPPAKKVKGEASHSISLDVYREKREKERLQSKVPAQQSVDTPVPQIKKPQHAFHESEKLLHRTSKHAGEMPFTVPNKERIPAVKEETALDNATSINKINHQVSKLNSNGSHHKDRSSHPLKFPHQAIEPVIKPEKVMAVPIPTERIELSKLEKIYSSKSTNEKLDRSKPNRLDYQQERSDVIKQERIEPTKPERYENTKQVLVESTKQPLNNIVKPEKVEPLRIEKTEPIKLEKSDYSRHERTDSFKQTRVETSSRHEKLNAVRHEKPDAVRHERPDAVRHERPDAVRRERPDAVHEKPDAVRQEKSMLMFQDKKENKREKVEVKQEREISHYEQTDVIRPEKNDLIKLPKVETKIEQTNTLPDMSTQLSIPVSQPSHKESSSASGDVIKKERREKHKKHSGHSSKSKHEKKVTKHIENAPSASLKVKIKRSLVNFSGFEPDSSQKNESDIPKTKIKIKNPEPPALPKIIIAKDKSGSGQYISTPKSDHDKSSRKHVHSNSVSGSRAAYDGTPSKNQKLDQSQKSHHSSGSGKSSKSSRHSSHKSSSEHSMLEGGYNVQQRSANGSNASNAQSYSQNYIQQIPHSSKPPKIKSYNTPVGKTNTVNPPLPLEPQPPPPPCE